MIPVRLSFRYEFTPGPSCGNVFVFLIPAQNLIPVRVHPGHCTEARFSFQYENAFRCLVNTVRPCDACVFLTSNPRWRHNHVGWYEVSLHVNGEGDLIPLCEHDMTSQCQTDMELALVRVFTCKHPTNSN